MDMRLPNGKVSQTPGENPFSAGASLKAAGQLHGGWLVPPSGRGQKMLARSEVSYGPYKSAPGAKWPKRPSNRGETAAVSYTPRHGLTTPRSGPSDATQTQCTACSNRSKRPAAAEKRLDYC